MNAGIKSIGSSELTAANLYNYRSDNLGDALKNISGLSTISTGQNIVKPVIHGLHSNRVLIINNGIRHEFQNWGVEHAPEIDASQADRIEVLKEHQQYSTVLMHWGE
ncbi:MAG: Plug domain-containing protein [Flammeovirgaceae bacterium]|nr:Plug domain-containing protein [Flammeovirgaceae bacterium]